MRFLILFAQQKNFHGPLVEKPKSTESVSGSPEASIESSEYQKIANDFTKNFSKILHTANDLKTMSPETEKETFPAVLFESENKELKIQQIRDPKGYESWETDTRVRTMISVPNVSLLLHSVEFPTGSGKEVLFGECEVTGESETIKSNLIQIEGTWYIFADYETPNEILKKLSTDPDPLHSTWGPLDKELEMYEKGDLEWFFRTPAENLNQLLESVQKKKWESAEKDFSDT
ncbi:MAG: hypothetical protein K9M51_03510 [Candidatus Gracilibacteria bacterium]|nr:hypothetical protein [Candidatus Gracilibacteria bacterium]